MKVFADISVDSVHFQQAGTLVIQATNCVFEKVKGDQTAKEFMKSFNQIGRKLFKSAAELIINSVIPEELQCNFAQVKSQKIFIMKAVAALKSESSEKIPCLIDWLYEEKFQKLNIWK